MTTHTDAPVDDLPHPTVTYADHSYPAYSAQQMRDYAAARIRSLEAQRDEAVGLLTKSAPWIPTASPLFKRVCAFLDSLKEGR